MLVIIRLVFQSRWSRIGLMSKETRRIRLGEFVIKSVELNFHKKLNVKLRDIDEATQRKSALTEGTTEVYETVGIGCGMNGPAWWNELRKLFEE